MNFMKDMRPSEKQSGKEDFEIQRISTFRRIIMDKTFYSRVNAANILKPVGMDLLFVMFYVDALQT